MTWEMTAHVMIAMPHITTAFAGNQGKAAESSRRHASLPWEAGTNAADTRIWGAPMMAVMMIVRRGGDGIRAARIATNMTVPISSIIVT